MEDSKFISVYLRSGISYTCFTVVLKYVHSSVKNNWSHITDMKDAKHIESMRDQMSDLMGAMADVDSTAVSRGFSVYESLLKCT